MSKAQKLLEMVMYTNKMTQAQVRDHMKKELGLPDFNTSFSGEHFQLAHVTYTNQYDADMITFKDTKQHTDEFGETKVNLTNIAKYVEAFGQKYRIPVLPNGKFPMMAGPYITYSLMEDYLTVKVLLKDFNASV